MRWVFFLCVLGWAASFLPAAAKENVAVASVIDIDGPRLMTNRLRESHWYQAYPGMEAFRWEKLRSDLTTTACLEFVIGGRAVIAPGSEVQLQGERDLASGGQTLIVTAGRVWAKIDQQTSQLQIQTQGGVIGIEGTEFFLEVTSDGETEITMLEGEVTLQGVGGQTDRLRAGEGARMGRSSIRRMELAQDLREALASHQLPEARRLLATRKLPLTARRAVLGGALHRRTAPARTVHVLGDRRHVGSGRFFPRRRDAQATGQTHPSGPTEILVAPSGSAPSDGATELPRPGPTLTITAEVGVDGRPKFCWGEAPAGAALVEVEILGPEDPTNLGWRGRSGVDPHCLEFPAQARPLVAGVYVLLAKVYDSEGGEMARSEPVRFETGSWEGVGISVP